MLASASFALARAIPTVRMTNLVRVVLGGEDVLDGGSDGGAGGIGAADVRRHRPAPRLRALQLGREAAALEKREVGL